MPEADLLTLAVSLAHRAGAFLLEWAGTALLAATKSSPTDAVTELDRQSEALILDSIRAARPDDSLVGEEGGATAGTSGIRWVVDPLDGTVNYLYAHPSGWSVSIAAEDDAGPLVGVVHDPPRRETFTAQRGGGAFLNGEPIAPSDCEGLATALLGTGFSYSADIRQAQARVLQGVLPRVRDIRRAGSAALDLCWVACGRLDGFYELMLAPWDYAAGSLVVSEAGGVFERREGDGLIVAGGPRVHAALSALLRQ